MNYKDATTILGLPDTWDEGMLKKAYRQKALKFHPDKNQSVDASFQFDLVKQAFEYLVDNRHHNKSRKTFSEKGDDDGGVDISDLFAKLKPFSPDKLQKLFGACKEVVGITKEMMGDISKKPGRSETKYEIEADLSKMLNDEVYMLKHNGTPLLVPLWFDDVYYEDVNGANDVVSISVIPKFPKDVKVSVKDDNHMVVRVPFDKLSSFNPTQFQSPNARSVDFDVAKLWKGSKITLWDVGLLKVFEASPDKMNTKEREGVTFIVV